MGCGYFARRYVHQQMKCCSVVALSWPRWRTIYPSLPHFKLATNQTLTKPTSETNQNIHLKKSDTKKYLQASLFVKKSVVLSVGYIMFATNIHHALHRHYLFNRLDTLGLVLQIKHLALLVLQLDPGAYVRPSHSKMLFSKKSGAPEPIMLFF